ncbi:MAG: D-amino acid aminotransferase [Burkholderiaceae bacterium]
MMPYRTDHLPALPCYLNGEITTLDQARISPLDRGFIFGDGVYEGIAFYSRPGEAARPFRFEQHMARLERSLKETQIANPHTRAEWKQIALDLVAAHPEAGADGPLDWFYYFQVTRGVALRDHPMLPGLTPTVFATCLPLKPPTAEQRAQGVACVTADDFRWKKAHIKSISLLGAVFARQLSYEQGALETVMFRDGFLSEAAASNVWVVKDGKVMGPPKDNLVLEGIRYGAIEEICRAAGIGFELRRLPRAEVLAADELLLSSATKEVLPITTLDGQPVGTGKPGPVYARLYAAYQQAKEATA